MMITRHIPNTITSMNLLCGVAGIVMAFSGRFDMAFYLMLGAAVCDFLDGFAARLLKAYSPLGKELDSLADLISFGLLPSFILYNAMKGAGATFPALFPLMIVVFSALRLAKFNIDERQSENFIGLATPACAMICGSFVYYISADMDSVLRTWFLNPYFVPAASVLLSFLLVSEIPMFSLKIKKGAGRKSLVHKLRMLFTGMTVVFCILVAILGLNWSMIILLSLTGYLVINIMAWLFRKR